MSIIALKFFNNNDFSEEAVHRLRRMHWEKSGKELLFGEIAFIFHDGKFQGIEERSKLRIFRAPKPESSLQLVGI